MHDYHRPRGIRITWKPYRPEAIAQPAEQLRFMGRTYTRSEWQPAFLGFDSV